MGWHRDVPTLTEHLDQRGQEIAQEIQNNEFAGSRDTEIYRRGNEVDAGNAPPHR